MDLMSWWLHSPRRWPAESSGARHKGHEPLVMVPRSVTYGLPMVRALCTVHREPWRTFRTVRMALNLQRGECHM